VADSLRLRDAIRDLKAQTEELQRVASEVNRLDRAVEKVKWYAWLLILFTALTAFGTLRLAWSTDRMAHYAAETYDRQAEPSR
jgi:hypothetical protein